MKLECSTGYPASLLAPHTAEDPVYVMHMQMASTSTPYTCYQTCCVAPSECFTELSLTPAGAESAAPRLHGYDPTACAPEPRHPGLPCVASQHCPYVFAGVPAAA